MINDMNEKSVGNQWVICWLIMSIANTQWVINDWLKRQKFLGHWFVMSGLGYCDISFQFLGTCWGVGCWGVKWATEPCVEQTRVEVKFFFKKKNWVALCVLHPHWLKLTYSYLLLIILKHLFQRRILTLVKFVWIKNTDPLVITFRWMCENHTCELHMKCEWNCRPVSGFINFL